MNESCRLLVYSRRCGMLYQLAERSAEFAFHKQNVKARV
jgi:hypothetical protein